jgi:hypothetical protein
MWQSLALHERGEERKSIYKPPLEPAEKLSGLDLLRNIGRYRQSNDSCVANFTTEHTEINPGGLES